MANQESSKTVELTVFFKGVKITSVSSEWAAYKPDEDIISFMMHKVVFDHDLPYNWQLTVIQNGFRQWCFTQKSAVRYTLHTAS